MLISADRVLQGPAEKSVDRGAVWIDGTTIRAVDTREVLDDHVPVDVPRWHYPGSSIVPGLINSHVHLSFDSSSDPISALLDASDAQVWTGMVDRAESALRSGVTTLRDLGSRGDLAVRLRDEIRKGEFTGPRVVASGPPLTPPGGHCWFFGGTVADDDEIRDQVRYLAELGVDVIKVMASGGQLTPDSPPSWASQFDRRQLDLIVSQATRWGLPVAVHAHGTTSIRDAVQAGVTTVEHCSWSTETGYERDADVAALMADRGIYACAASSRNWPQIMGQLPEGRVDEIYGRLTWMASRGVPLITGTDAGLQRSPFDDLVGALHLYTHLGFAAATVLEMATTSSATALGLGAVTGVLAAGFDGDLLVTDGDPRTDLDALRDPTLVVARGRIVNNI